MVLPNLTGDVGPHQLMRPCQPIFLFFALLYATDSHPPLKHPLCIAS